MNYNDYETDLYTIEQFGSDNNLIDSEESLSNAFDEMIAEAVITQYGADDTVAMSEAFNNWSDSLCKDGELHSQQYQDYCYIGKHSD